MAGRPATLMQGTLGMILLAGVGFSITITDVMIPGIGAGVTTVVLAVACVQAMRISRRFEAAKTWQIAGAAIADERPDETRLTLGNRRLAFHTAAAVLTIVAGGSTLALTGDALAEATGLGSSIVGFTLVGFSTSLPELSTVLAAIRMGRYQLAIGDIFGTNLFNVQILFLADMLYREGALLNAAGTFEIGACFLAALLTGVFMVGWLERRNRTIGKIGVDSALVLVCYAAGLFALSRV